MRAITAAEQGFALCEVCGRLGKMAEHARGWRGWVNDSVKASRFK
jgi:hypothetical protein